MRKNYGAGRDLTMLEGHYLINIHDNPGITNSEIAKKWNKSKSAVLQTIKKLIEWNYVVREIGENASQYLLYTTEEGDEIVYAHKNYDNIDIVKTNKRLLKDFTIEELIAFRKVCIKYQEILKENYDT